MGLVRGPSSRRRKARRRRLLTRAVPVVAVAAAAFAAGAVLATAPERAERHLVTRYVTAWQNGDYGAMYALLDATSRRAICPASSSPPSSAPRPPRRR